MNKVQRENKIRDVLYPPLFNVSTFEEKKSYIQSKMNILGWQIEYKNKYNLDTWIMAKQQK